MAAALCQILFFLVAFFLYTGVQAPSFGDLRLVGLNEVTSSSLTAGRLEVYYYGQWGTVCDNLFGSSEAIVACQQLGFSDYVSYGNISTRFQTASSSTPIWLDNLSCSIFGDSRLIDCSRNAIGSTDCAHLEDVYVSCEGTGALRIGSTDLSSHGRLEVYFDGRWGTVCSNSFFQTEANAACRQLGYSFATDYGSVQSLGYSYGSGPIWLKSVDCASSIMLTACIYEYNKPGFSNYFHSDDAAVVCDIDILHPDSGSIPRPDKTVNTEVNNTDSTGLAIIIATSVLPFLCIGVCTVITCIAVFTGACGGGSSTQHSRNHLAIAITGAVASTAAAPPTVVVTSTSTAQAQPRNPDDTSTQEKPPVKLIKYPQDTAYPPATVP